MTGQPPGSASGTIDVGELVPVEGGEWHGLLFDNPTLGLAAQLTWSLRVPFPEVTREYGSSPVSLDLEWISFPTGDWRCLAGQGATSAQFAEPGEASVYCFAHHRYDAIDLRVLEQHGPRIRVRATVSGDLDGLGAESLVIEAWLRFTGIIVSLRGVDRADEALARLRDFTDATGLTQVPDPGGIHFRFAPADTSAG
jgi:hypothetical protein